MVDVRMFARIIRKDRKNVEKLFLDTNNETAMFIGHFWNIILTKFKLVDITLSLRAFGETFCLGCRSSENPILKTAQAHQN